MYIKIERKTTRFIKDFEIDWRHLNYALVWRIEVEPKFTFRESNPESPNPKSIVVTTDPTKTRGSSENSACLKRTASCSREKTSEVVSNVKEKLYKTTKAYTCRKTSRSIEVSKNKNLWLYKAEGPEHMIIEKRKTIEVESAIEDSPL